MLRIFLVVILQIIFLFQIYAQDVEKLTKAKGGKFYGGTMKVNENEFISTLFPPSAQDFVSKRTISCIYEGLVKFDDENLELKPCLAESWNLSDDKKIYTFKLRKNVLYHDDACFSEKGRQMVASDIEYVLTFLCSSDPLNKNYNLFRDLIQGGKECFEGTSKNVEGIKVIDQNTIQISLVRPSFEFLYLLADAASSIYPKEYFYKYKEQIDLKAVGTGPFYLEQVDDGYSIALKKNSNYYLTDDSQNKLPFLSGVNIKFIKDKKMELLEFKKGNLDMMYRVPPDHIIEIEEEATRKKGEYGKYELQRTPELLTLALWFNLKVNPGKSLSFRKAMSYAINRSFILEASLNGEGYSPALHGVTAPQFNDQGYDINKIKGYDYNSDSARYYLKRSGFNKEEQVKLVAFSEGDRNLYVAEEIQKQLMDLGLNVNLEILPLSSIMQDASFGKPGIYLLPLKADYPSPQSFLENFYSKEIPADTSKPSYINISRYKNPLFNKYYETALNAETKEKSYWNFMMAEKVLMRDAAILPLFYDEGYRMLQAHVKNFPNNALQYRDLSEVYFLNAAEKDKGKKETGNSKTKVEKMADEVCRAMEFYKEDDASSMLEAAKRLGDISSNKEYREVSEYQFLEAMKKKCPEGYKKFKKMTGQDR